MNKKFFTLLMAISLMLTSGLSAQVPTGEINFYTGVVSIGNSVTTVTSSDGGYTKGKSYYLGNGSSFLQVTQGANPSMRFDALPNSLKGLRLSLWTLIDIIAPEGAIAPKYIFMNDFTGVVLAMDKDKALDFAGTTTQDGLNYKLGGDVNEWLNAPSYKNPSLEPLYYALPNDSVAVLLVNTTDNNSVYLSKMKKTDMTGTSFPTGVSVVKVQPYKAASSSNSTVTLSPLELNTMLIENAQPTKDSYFRLEFSDNPTMMGGENLFEVDLQAMAVRQFEQTYQKKANAEGSVTIASYASLYPYTEKYKAYESNASLLTTAKFEEWKNEDEIIGYSDDAAQWVALKNRDGKYLRVSHTTIDGTEQGENNRMTFEFADLYNAKKDTRFHDPRSYLFRIDYNPVTNSVEIASMAYVYKQLADAAKWPNDFNAETFYLGGYASQPIQKNSRWYADDATNVRKQADKNTYVVKASLLNINEVTIGEYADTNVSPSNKFVIKLGSTNRAFAFKRTAYLLQVTGSKDKNRLGKYYVKNLKGGFELVEQAPRQDFHNMPAAQWVLTAARTSAGTPVKLTNREFPVTNNYDFTVNENAKLEGILYAGYGSNEAFFIDSRDTLAFVEVRNPKDEYLGYKYAANDTINESTFYFKYLHELQMNKPLEIVKDSVVAVKSGEGDGIFFSLENVLDDQYGFNGDLATVAKLKRRVYKIYVNDASKIDDQKQYVRYDKDLKKYVVSEERINNDDDAKSVKAALFFLKENNYDAGASYYTLIPANVGRMVKATKSGNTYYGTTAGGDYVSGYAGDGLFLATKGGFYNVSTGLVDTDKDIIAGFANSTDATAYANTWMNRYGVTNLLYQIVQFKTKSIETANLGSEITLYGVMVDQNEANYASYKAAVDVNTLELVNGILSNQTSMEVATSAFTLVKNDDPLYRTLGDAGEETFDENLVKFYRVLHGAEKEYLYEDANTSHSTGLGLNFLGIEGKGDITKPTMWTKYIPNKNKVMPQYLIAVGVNKIQGEAAVPCPEHGWNCEHVIEGTPDIIEGRFLVNFQDSIDVNDKPAKQKFQYNAQYTRLGFVPAKLIGDSLIIDNSIYTGNTKPIEIGKPATWASKDTIALDDNLHKNVVFQFRLIRTGSNDFLIESETQKDGKNIKNSALEKAAIAPIKGGWVKIQNGVPVIANTTYSEAGMDAEIFNLEVSSEEATSNEGIENSKVSVAAGEGYVVVKGAASKQVVVANVLGQVVANQVLTSDEATIAAPAGVVVVSVDGTATKALVK